MADWQKQPSDFWMTKVVEVKRESLLSFKNHNITELGICSIWERNKACEWLICWKESQEHFFIVFSFCGPFHPKWDYDTQENQVWNGRLQQHDLPLVTATTPKTARTWNSKSQTQAHYLTMLQNKGVIIMSECQGNYMGSTKIWNMKIMISTF